MRILPRPAALLVGCLLVLACGAARGQTLPPGWSPELGEAFALYYAGRYRDVAAVCRSIVESGRSAQVCGDAQALSAMALMRQEARSDRIDGRTRLGRAAERDPTLMDRPDCRFALGVARSALGETATALGELLPALEEFEREQRPQRVLEACVAIADTWSRFAEWNTPIPAFPLAVPESHDAAFRERQRRVAEMRAKAATLPDSADAVRRIDLIAAQMNLTRPELRPAALDSLRAIASIASLDEIAADAALHLAEELRADNRLGEALEIYRRVAAARLGDRSQRAELLAGEALRPRLEMTLQGTPRPAGKFRLNVTANRVRSVELEVRRVDLAAHLAQRQGVLLEQYLPDDGAIIGSQTVRAPDGAGDAWSTSVEFDAPAGALVALARGTDSGGATLRANQVVVVSALDAAVIAGTRQALVIASPDVSQGAKARFWMQGSFVPVEIELTGGCGVLNLPPEARLLRDRRWVCLVTAETGMALCRGSLPGEAEADGAVRSIVNITPDRPRPGEEVLIAGALVGDAGPVDRDIVRRGVQLELCDTMDAVRAKTSVAVDASGVFSARMRIGPELAGAIVHPVVRGGGRVLTPLYGPVTARIATGDPRAADLELNLGTIGGSANEGLVRVEVRGMTAWGHPLEGGRAFYRLRGVRLPGGDDGSARVASGVYTSSARLDAGGRTSLSHPTAVFKLPPGAIGLNAEVSVETGDGRSVAIQREALAGGGPAHIWIEWDEPGDLPAESRPAGARVGDVFHLRVGWFDPRSVAAGAIPRLAIRAPGGDFVDYPLHPDRGGLLATDWLPWCVGEHELRATLALETGEPATAHRRVVIAGLDGQASAVTAFDAGRAADRPDEIDIRVVTADARPLLVVLVGQNPIGAAWLPARSGERKVRIPFPRMPGTGALATLLELRDGVVRTVGSRPVTAPPDELRIAGLPHKLLPGSLVALSIEPAGGVSLDGATLIARLTSADETGAVDWVKGGTGGTPTETDWLPVITSGSGESTLLPTVSRLPGEAGVALLRGRTHWSDVARSPSGAAKLRVSVPDTPGRARLRVAALWPDGRVAVLDQLVSVDGPVRMDADLPEALTRGDRTIASVRLSSATGRPVSGMLRATGARGLTLGEWSVGAGRAELTQTPGDLAVTVAVPAAGNAYLHLPVEASAVGRGVVRFEFVADGATVSAEASYRVLETPVGSASRPATSTSTPPVRIARTLYVVAPLDAQAQAALEAATDSRRPQVPSLANQPRIEIRDQRALAIGTLVLVEESIETEQTLADISWTQPAAANCITRLDSRREFRALSAEVDVRAGQYSHQPGQLAAGRTVHQYLLVVSRPGTCSLPAPVVRSGGTTLRVELGPTAAPIVAGP